MNGENPSPWPEEGWIKAPEDFCSKEVVVDGFVKSSEKAMAMADAFSSDEMEAPLKTEESETTRAERCRFMTLHLWYHSGQLNFIQTLLGDDAWHWA